MPSTSSNLFFLLWGYAVLCLPEPPPYHTPNHIATQVDRAVRETCKHIGAAMSYDPTICFSWFALFTSLDFKLFWWVFLGLWVLIRFLSVRVKWIWLFFVTYFFVMQIIISWWFLIRFLSIKIGFCLFFVCAFIYLFIYFSCIGYFCMLLKL